MQDDSSALAELNRQYVNAFTTSDADWYDAHLASDFVCIAPDGSVIERAEFIRGSRQPMSYRAFSLESVSVKLVGDVALITAVTPFVRADGTAGASRYTDTWVRRDGEWKTLQANITPITSR